MRRKREKSGLLHSVPGYPVPIFKKKAQVVGVFGKIEQKDFFACKSFGPFIDAKFFPFVGHKKNLVWVGDFDFSVFCDCLTGIGWHFFKIE